MKSPILSCAMVLTFSLGVLSAVYAGSATWNLNPTSGDWNTAANWTPATVPNGPNDTASFDASNTNAVSLSQSTEVNGIVFNPGASAFTISNAPDVVLTISGAGVANSSGVFQSFVNPDSGELHFATGATAGESVVYTNQTQAFGGRIPLIQFEDNSTAGTAQFINLGMDSSPPSDIEFYGNSTAGSGIFRNTGGLDGALFPTINFHDQASAGQAVFTNEAPSGGTIRFFDSTTADQATFTNGPAFGSQVLFWNNSTAGNATIINEGGNYYTTVGVTQFYDNSTAGSGLFIADGSFTTSFGNASVTFFGTTTAGNGTFIANGGQISGASGGVIDMLGSSSAENGIFYANGATVDGAFGGRVYFTLFGPTAATATLITTNGVGNTEDAGGGIIFHYSSVGAEARVQVFGNGFLDMRGHDAPGVTIGSLEGDGLVFLGDGNLSVGSNNLSTIFSGLIEENSAGTTGALTKIGVGMLKLSSANTYTGSTTVNAGGLVINNTTGSGTGTGAVQVNGGILAGKGTIAGAVTVGTGGGTGAFLTPGMGASKATTLTIQSALTFKADGTYTCRLNTKKTKADQLIANGVTIESGAQFAFKVTGDEQLQIGKSATVISNTAATPISGTFANLPDGSTFTIGRNTYQVSYSGGDGNDLTLTVVP